jgi:tRNA (mo5U34)-methyltransferase
MRTTVRKAPPAPADFRPEQLTAGSAYWHQRWEIFDGVETPGHNPIAEMCEALRLPDDLSGKRVLDIGAWNGCLSLECERRGAGEVLAIGPENPDVSGFKLLCELAGSTRTRYEYGTVYDLDPDKIGRFDIVLFCGVLYHLRYPMLGIDNLRRVCRGELLIETLICDRTLNRELKGASRLPIWRFYRHDELEGDHSNWFGPNAFAVVQAVESAGFDVQHADAWMLGRGAFRATVKPGLPEFLTEPTIEGVFYDQITAGLYGPKDEWRLGPSTQEMFPATAAENYDSAYFGGAAWRWRQHALWSRMRNKIGRWLNAA